MIKILFDSAEYQGMNVVQEIELINETMKTDLEKIEAFCTGSGREFDKEIIKETLDTFEIKHSPI